MPRPPAGGAGAPRAVRWASLWERDALRVGAYGVGDVCAYPSAREASGSHPVPRCAPGSARRPGSGCRCISVNLVPGGAAARAAGGIGVFGRFLDYLDAARRTDAWDGNRGSRESSDATKTHRNARRTPAVFRAASKK